MSTRRLAYTIAGPDCAEADPFAFDAPLEEALAAIAGCGYEGIELQVRDPAAIDVGALRSALDTAGVSVAAVATGHVRTEDGLDLSDPACREAATERLERIVEFAADLGAVVTIGKVRGSAPPADTARVAGVLDSLGRIGARAASVGTVIALEPQNRFVGPLFTRVGEVVGLIEQEGWEGGGILLDTFHMAIEERSIPGALVEAGEHLVHVQLGENHRGPMGDGTVPLSAVLHVLDALGYTGWLSMEHTQDGDSAKAARRSAQAVALAAPATG